MKRSRRQAKTERRITRLHARAGYVRRDALHKLTTALASEHRTVVVEKLNAKGLCRSGNRGLRRALHDASLAEIRRQLAYKTLWHDGTLIGAPTFYPSSKTCSNCQAVKAKLAPRRAHVPLRALRPGPRPGPERRDQPRSAPRDRRPEWWGDDKRAVAPALRRAYREPV